MTAISLPIATRPDPRTLRRVLAGVAAIAAVLLFVLFQGQWTLPHDQDFTLFKSLNGVRAWVDENRTILDPIRLGVAALVDGFVARSRRSAGPACSRSQAGSA